MAELDLGALLQQLSPARAEVPALQRPRLNNPLAIGPSVTSSRLNLAEPLGLTPNALAPAGDANARAQLAQQATHLSPQAPAPTTLQDDVGGLLAGLDSGLGGVTSAVNQFQAEQLPGLAPALDRANEVTQGTLDEVFRQFGMDVPTNPVVGTLKEVPGVLGRGLDSLFGKEETPQLEAPEETPKTPETPPALVTQESITSDDVVAAAADPKQTAEIQKHWTQDPGLNAMMMGVGLSLLRGEGVAEAIGKGMQALSAQKTAAGVSAAAKAKGAREDTRLGLEVKADKRAERKLNAELRKLNIEADKAAKGGGTEADSKLLIKMFENIANSAEGLDLTTDQIAAQSEKLMGRFKEGTAVQEAARTTLLAIEDPEERLIAAQKLKDSGVSIEVLRAALGK